MVSPNRDYIKYSLETTDNASVEDMLNGIIDDPFPGVFSVVLPVVVYSSE